MTLTDRLAAADAAFQRAVLARNHRETCCHQRCVIDIWAMEYRVVCTDCRAVVPDTDPLAAARPCGCTRDPFVFGHLHLEER